MSKTVLAALVHDPDGVLAAPLARAGDKLRSHFEGIVLSITDATDANLVTMLEQDLRADVIRHPVGEAIIGYARRSAVGHALSMGATRVVYADFDSALRWAEGQPGEVAAMLARAEPFLIVGRDAGAFAQLPERLRRTEDLNNHVYFLMTGLRADLFAAVRSMDRITAQMIVDQGRENSVGNDVEWPLLVAREGVPVGYLGVSGLTYRTNEEYDAPSDSFDLEPFEWVRRIEFAAEAAKVYRRFLKTL